MCPDQSHLVVVDISSVVIARNQQELSYLWTTPSRDFNTSTGHSDVKKLVNFENEIKQFYQRNPQSSNRVEWQEEAVACLFYHDRWRRVEIVSVKDNGIVSVFLLDFGGFAVCHSDELRKIPDNIEVPKVCCNCILHAIT